MIPRCFLFIHRRDKRLTPALGAFLDYLRDQPATGSEVERDTQSQGTSASQK